MSKAADPAFPLPPMPPMGGLAKRELFAAMAMQGLLASGERATATNNATYFADALLECLREPADEHKTAAELQR